MKKVLAITGIRSEYDILYPILKRLQEHEGFNIRLVVSSAHLSNWHGFTIEHIKRDGFEIADQIDCLLMTNRSTQRAKGIGILIASLTQTIEREQPDFLMAIGDREESLATCIVGNYMNILTTHIGGGDPVYGNADDPVRMACSKLAHIHFVTAKPYVDNLKRLSEEVFRICFSGNPALCNIMNAKIITEEQISQFLKIDVCYNRYIVLLQHPLSSAVDDSYDHMKVILTALRYFIQKNKMKVIGIYPNTDPGAYDIIRAIEEINNDSIYFFKSFAKNCIY